MRPSDWFLGISGGLVGALGAMITNRLSQRNETARFVYKIIFFAVFGTVIARHVKGR